MKLVIECDQQLTELSIKFAGNGMQATVISSTEDISRDRSEDTGQDKPAYDRFASASIGDNKPASTGVPVDLSNIDSLVKDRESSIDESMSNAEF